MLCIVLKIWSSNLRMIKSHAVLQTVCHYFNIMQATDFALYCGNIPHNTSSLFEPDVVCSVSVIPLQHRSCSGCMSFVSWATSTGKLLGSKIGNSIVFPKNTALCYHIKRRTKVSQFTSLQLLAWRSTN